MVGCPDASLLHRLLKYRGVVSDVDPVFSLTDEWYEAMARSKPPIDEPWYHVLVDGMAHMTYVAQRKLRPDGTNRPVVHPCSATCSRNLTAPPMFRAHERIESIRIPDSWDTLLAPDRPSMTMLKFPKPGEILWSLERDEAVFTIEQDGHPIHCRVTLEALEEYASGAKIEDGLSAAQEYLFKIEDDAAALIAAGSFESDGSVLLKALDVQRMRPR